MSNSEPTKAKMRSPPRQLESHYRTPRRELLLLSDYVLLFKSYAHICHLPSVDRTSSLEDCRYALLSQHSTLLAEYSYDRDNIKHEDDRIPLSKKRARLAKMMDMIRTIEKAFEDDAKSEVLESLRSRDTVEELESEGSKMVETSSRNKRSRLARDYQEEQEKSKAIADRAEYTERREGKLPENSRLRAERIAKIERASMMGVVQEDIANETKKKAEMLKRMEERRVEEIERIAEIRSKRTQEAMERTAEVRRKRKREEAEDEEFRDEEDVEEESATEDDEGFKEDEDWEMRIGRSSLMKR